MRAASAGSDTGPVRVGELLHCYLAPTENWCYRLLDALSGVQLTVVTANLSGEERFPLRDARFVVGPLARRFALGTTAAEGLLVTVRRALLLAWRPWVIWRCRKLQLLHAHFSFMAWDYLWLARALSLPLVVSFYGFDYEWLPGSDPKWVRRYGTLFREASMFLTEGEFGRSRLIEMGCPPSKVRVLHLGVDPGSIPLFKREKRPGRLRLLQMASFTEKKGYDVTVEAFARALARCPEMTLTLVGRDQDGLRGRIQARIAELGVGGRVEMVDGVPFEELHRFFADFDVFIHPSRYSASRDCEGGAPVVLLDAQATGLPVISTTHCDIPDEVVHGESGLLAPEGDVAALAAFVERFYLMDDAEYQRFSRAARRHVEKEYDLSCSAAQLREIYREVARSSEGADH
ncbi:glycosyltransferase [Geomonas sp. Red32]|uniref:glycosyltransferase n=1 Tax=Geomonas sp. Red32 TaxID=2912856 RepID=UPI00202CCA00|nr:glycosyltransferase [Geomonas sp. Red32]